MKCGQGKPFKSYQMGGLVTKGPEKVPQDIDMISSLKGKERADAEKRMGVKPPAPRASEAGLTAEQRKAIMQRASEAKKK
jgi:hypothetical protein